MPRSLVLGNGNMLVNFDNKGHLKEFYYPYVGLEDHTTYGHYHRVGIYEVGTGEFSWISDDHWQADVKYLDETLIGDITLRSEKWKLELKINDFVTVRDNILCRKIKVNNLMDHDREFRIYFSYDFHLYGTKTNDTVYYAPGHNALVFYKLNRYMLVNAVNANGGIIDQYATGKSEYEDLEGTWRDAEDGELSGNPITQGSVDATFGINIKTAANQSETIFSWICAGATADEVYELNRKLKNRGLEHYYNDTLNYWRRWVNKQDFNFEGIPADMVQLFKQSLLIVRTQMDNRGAIIAANDTDIMKFNKDTYSYMWPRDGALVAHAMDNAGYTELTERFYRFCARVETREGYLMHKYNPDESVGSSWHPWIYKDCPQSPLQEDETALPIMSLWNHYQRVPNIEFLHEMYDEFVRKSADFLVRYRDAKTGLPLPSYDLWEEQHGIFTFTVAATYAGLLAAKNICDTLGHFSHRDRYAKAAAEVKEAALKYLYSEEHERFVKKINVENGQITELDATIDSSMCGVFLFNLLPVNDPKVVSTMKQMRSALEVKTDVGGFARYENDYYHRHGDYPDGVPGNPWIITTLWYAQWCFGYAKDVSDPYFKEGMKFLRWATKQTNSALILAEQYDPFTNEPLSVGPLTWSHATYVDTIMVLRERLTDFGVCKDCMLPRFGADSKT